MLVRPPRLDEAETVLVVNPANSTAVVHLRGAGCERAGVHRRMRGSLDDAPAPPAAAAVRRLHLDTGEGWERS